MASPGIRCQRRRETRSRPGEALLANDNQTIRSRKLFRFYKFECQCVACAGDWPLCDMLGLSLPQGQVTREEVDEVNKMVGKVMDVLTNQQQWEAGLVLLRAVQGKMALVLPTPSLELFNTTIAVWRALWLMVGNKKLIKVF